MAPKVTLAAPGVSQGARRSGGNIRLAAGGQGPGGPHNWLYPELAAGRFWWKVVP